MKIWKTRLFILGKPAYLTFSTVWKLKNISLESEENKKQNSAHMIYGQN
jgi:hypothetical protein